MKSIRHLAACIIGNIIEWYEFSLFAYLAPTISALFFPAENRVTGLLLTFSVFASGFFIRPFGAVLLGHLGDRLGRAKTLKLTIFFISLASVMTGFLPTFSSFGVLASVLLILCRLIQGFCIGGEFAGAMVYLTESAPAHRRAFLSAMTNNGSNLGVLLAISACAFVSSVLTPAHFLQYGWRVLFIFGGVLGLLGLWLRRDMAESETFERIARRASQYVPFVYVLKTQSLKLLSIFALLCISACGSYVLMGYLSTYLHVFLGLPLSRAYAIQTEFIIVSLLLVPLFAWMNDRYGRKGVLAFAIVGYIFFAIPIFYGLPFYMSAWILLPLAIFYSAEQASTPVIMAEMLPAKGRYTGVSIAYNLNMALVGGTAAFVNTVLIHFFHDPMMIAYYIVGCSIISGVIVFVFPPKNVGAHFRLDEVV
ncbi:MAG: hypothetical protein COV52_05260 [Gammaproteobacteria bacterium CG11_big_fil_rev_8_21_14_0_20_46_22]|nr:MAG: hypothetical protein COW05_09995 [Gammaproteobacteria bacterium CG12_big_fil_rev_8_21_14_0_65_46_12]PIR11205.1 MAG: hypothetical protein COV52_05260 [Gammaproteobacteria bacterium CG11_big_fil_rev_8_21_14_0_20_46_22]